VCFVIGLDPQVFLQGLDADLDVPLRELLLDVFERGVAESEFLHDAGLADVNQVAQRLPLFRRTVFCLVDEPEEAVQLLPLLVRPSNALGP
jgi:hypothetical protein